MSSGRHTIGSLRAWVLGLSLTLALGLISVLAYQAVQLDRSHRTVADGVIRDYAGFAADQFTRLATSQIRSLTGTILEPIACRASSAARFSAAVKHIGSDIGKATCTHPRAVDGFFEIDPVTGTAEFTTGAIDDATRHAIARIPLDDSFNFQFLPGAGSPRIVGYLAGTMTGGEKRIVGFVAPAAIVQPIFDRILHDERLLPGSLTDPAQNRDYLTIDIADPSGQSIYRSGENASAFAAERVLGPAALGARVQLGINEAAAGRLIIGGVPHSRLPLFVSLLLLTAALLAIGTWQLQREHRLATMRVDFVRSASHELRTPLAQMRLFTETLQLGRVRSWSEVQRSLAFIDQQTGRLSRLVENLLTFARGGALRRGRREAIDLASFVADTAAGFEPVAAVLHHKMAVAVAEPCVAIADREWLTQIVLNLLDNAAKYGPPGQIITVTVSRGKGEARISVDDQGPGVPQRDRTRIFAPFVRLSREPEQRTGGTGIGLSVAAELIAAMNGRIWAEDAPTKGTRFVVTLPLAEIERDDVARDHTSSVNEHVEAQSSVA